MGDNRVPSRDGEDDYPEKEMAEKVPMLEVGAAAPSDPISADAEVKVQLTVIEVENIAPRDSYFLVYVILLIHGIGVLMPWNMFITANDYFVDYKLKSVSSGNSTEDAERSVYQDYFLSSLCFVAQVPNVLLNAVNLFYKSKSANTSIRIIASIIVIIVVFMLTVVLAIVDSSSWPIAFFWITMITVVIINSANGIYQNSVYGLAACLPMKYTNAVVIGSNISGAVTSIIALISMLAAPSIRSSAIFYFCTAVFALAIALGAFLLLRRIPFYKHYAEKAATAVKKSDGEDGDAKSSKLGYLRECFDVFKICWKEDWCVFFVFFVTLSCFPAIQAGVRPVSTNFVISDRFFTIITCFIVFNFCAVLGSFLSSFVQKPGPKWAWLPILLRVLFIPFFMLCNFRPHSRRLPVVVTNDYVYCIAGILMALSSGYFSSLAMMYAPRKVEGERKGIAGMMAAFSLILGIFGGIIFSFPVIAFIENVGSYEYPHHHGANLTALVINDVSSFTLDTTIAATY